MGILRRAIGISALALFGPPVAAAIARGRLHSEGGEDDDDVKVVAIFDGERLRSRAAAFRAGQVLAWYGGADLDLREARLDASGARLRAIAVFGGARVIVPPEMPVVVSRVAFAGGVEVDAAEVTGRSPALVVDALAIFGGVQVTTRADVDDDVELAPPREAALARAEAEALEEAAAATVDADDEAETSEATPGA